MPHSNTFTDSNNTRQIKLVLVASIQSLLCLVIEVVLFYLQNMCPIENSSIENAKIRRMTQEVSCKAQV